ncbi:FAD-dependent thymidylate synthase [Intestinibacter sp.]|uniref:FAD-dependent thymidylate synthase n=1 Tax=Intestinibacter sp. TaxID=1965304 RepID=UPI003F163315
MNLIKPNFEILEQKPGIDGIYKIIESAGRTCYRSEDKITEDSAKAFVDRMIKSGHGAMLEHGTVYLSIDCSGRLLDIANKYVNDKYSKVSLHEDGIHYCITTNYRVLVENNWLVDLKYLCEPTEFHEKRITVRFICDRGVSHEFVRHRVFSFAQESTRYCNYSKNKFGNELTFIIPNWFNKYMDEDYSNFNTSNWNIGLDIADAETNWLYAMMYSEKAYVSSINNGMKPQQARAVLPNSLKTELVMTGFVSDWEHFFELRALGTTGAPHPQAKELAEPLMKEFERRGLLCITQ